MININLPQIYKKLNTIVSGTMLPFAPAMSSASFHAFNIFFLAASGFWGGFSHLDWPDRYDITATNAHRSSFTPAHRDKYTPSCVQITQPPSPFFLFLSLLLSSPFCLPTKYSLLRIYLYHNYGYSQMWSNPVLLLLGSAYILEPHAQQYQLNQPILIIIIQCLRTQKNFSFGIIWLYRMDFFF